MAASKGSNVRTDFLSAQLKKVGDQDPTLPDKRGAYKTPSAFLPIGSSWVSRPSTAPASRPAPPFASGLGQPRGSRAEVREEMTLSNAIKASTPSTLPGEGTLVIWGRLGFGKLALGAVAIKERASPGCDPTTFVAVVRTLS